MSGDPASIGVAPIRVALVGAGKMGGALLAGWLDQGIDPAGITVFEPSPSAELCASADAAGFRLAAAPTVADPAPDVLMLAVKPQAMADVLPAFRPLVAADGAVVSIAAGQPLRFLESVFGADAAIVRAMPNTPAAIRQGITVACANPAVDTARRARAERLLAAVGEVAWVEDEGLMDAVTAVSGSGPAYVFLLAECLAQAGCAAGLPEDLARRLARATVAGSGALLGQAADAPAVLRRNVTSPGGTTEAALQVLMAEVDGLPALMERAVARAAERSRALAG
jgi:pyrroline-5-carboxylate reductase